MDICYIILLFLNVLYHYSILEKRDRERSLKLEMVFQEKGSHDSPLIWVFSSLLGKEQTRENRAERRKESHGIKPGQTQP